MCSNWLSKLSCLSLSHSMYVSLNDYSATWQHFLKNSFTNSQWYFISSSFQEPENYCCIFMLLLCNKQEEMSNYSVGTRKIAVSHDYIVCFLTFRQRTFWNTCFRYRKKIVIELSRLQIQMTTFHFGEIGESFFHFFKCVCSCWFSCVYFQYSVNLWLFLLSLYFIQYESDKLLVGQLIPLWRVFTVKWIYCWSVIHSLILFV